MKKENAPKDFVAEAEKIIHNYINRKRQSAYAAFAREHKRPNLTSLQKHVAAAGRKPGADGAAAVRAKNPARRKKNSGLDLFLNLVMIMGCLVIVGMLMFSFL